MSSDALFIMAFYVVPSVAVLAAVVAVASRGNRTIALRVLAAAVIFLVAYWSVSFPE